MLFISTKAFSSKKRDNKAINHIENTHEVNQNTQQVGTITGTVSDEYGDPLPGASITLLPEKRIGQTTKIDGKYMFPNLKPGNRLLFSFIGMESVEIIIKQGQTVYNVKLRTSAQQLDEVMIEAGIIQRNKQGFTGDYKTVTQDELKESGNINLIQSLKSLDPSFVITENLSAGSNPNVMANIEIRGKTAVNITSLQEESQTGINTPLILIDGFEASLSEFNDLDINRVESVTLLKDAGSTAIYGSKGANGVIVIETVKPKTGEIMVRYNTNIQLSFPDLSVYNLMNAAEKLEFERLAKRWGTIEDQINIDNQSEYNRRLALVASGVDTYWLAEPVRNSITHNHSFSVSGGSKSLLFDAGLNYKDYRGVIKETGRETFGGNVKLVYRGIKGVNISNNMIVSGVNGSEGSWGSFADFAEATPYFKKRNADGTIPQYLDSYTTNATTSKASTTIYAVNPLYNAMLNSYKYDREFIFTNNTNLNWHITEQFMITGGLSLKKTSYDHQYFKDPRHSDYATSTYKKAGEYTGTKRNTWSYSTNLSASYSQTVAKSHNFTLISRGSLYESNSRTETYKLEGFPKGSKGIPSDAHYKEEASPSYNVTQRREVSALTAFNYNYLYRYLLDINYNIDGSTAFGSNKKFKDFWSIGLGWNLHKESFAENLKWLSEFKLTGTMGTNANQNQNMQTSSIYNYMSGYTQFGQGTYMSVFGNPDLQWQKTEKKGVSLDAGLFKNRLKVQASIYKHNTDPLIATINQRPSSGTGTYPLNFGYMDTKGYEFSVLFFPIFNKKENILFSIRVMGTHNNSTYGGFGKALDNLNDYLLSESNSSNLLSLQKYEDGKSPNDIWAVRSLGIDPATGREVFLNKDGEPVIRYNAKDRVVVGNTKPDMGGTVSLNLTWKKLQIYSSFRYSFGADRLNTALYNKVENISSTDLMKNIDKRALYDRWKTAGDIASFVDISQVKNGNPLSSRFVQKDNSFVMENVKITWDFSRDNWCKAIGAKELKVGISMNDIFRLSTIKMERGIDYPFARTVLFNLTTRF